MPFIRFLFHVKNSFCSQDIHTFVLTFWLCRKMPMVNSKTYDITEGATNNYNTHITQYIKK